MNIFYTDTCPVQAARNLDDLRMNKMISESIQMLSIAVFFLCDDPTRYTWGEVPNNFTRPWAYRNHPCSIWVREHPAHYGWLLAHCQAMLDLRRAKGATNSNAYKLKNCQTMLTRLKFPEDTVMRDPPFATVAEYPRMTDWRQRTITLNYQHYLMWKWDNDTIKLTWRFGEYPKSWRTTEFVL